MPRFDITVAGELNLDLILYGLPAEIPVERESRLGGIGIIVLDLGHVAPGYSVARGVRAPVEPYLDATHTRGIEGPSGDVDRRA